MQNNRGRGYEIEEYRGKNYIERIYALLIIQAMAVSNAQGKVTYKLSSAKKGKKSKKKYFTVAKSGKITVKKKLKKGTYKVKIMVTAAGSSTYKAAVKTVTVSIKVK